MGIYWLTRPEVIVERLRARGKFKSTGSRERQLLGTKWYGWTGVTLGGAGVLSGLATLITV